MSNTSNKFARKAPKNTKVPLPKKKILPCGTRTCLHCHRRCDMETAANVLREIDGQDDAAEAKRAE